MYVRDENGLIWRGRDVALGTARKEDEEDRGDFRDGEVICGGGRGETERELR